MGERVRIKICGLKRPEDVAMVNRYRPDFAGFVFAGTKRRITPEQAAELRSLLIPAISPVGVFVNEPVENIERLCKDGIIDIIQLHGDEPEEYIHRVKLLTGKTIIRAVRVRSAEDIMRWADTEAEYLLLDTYCAGEYGGSGESFSRRYIKEAREELAQQKKSLPKLILAGGLNAKNVGEAIREEAFYAVDVSSGVETDGCKDERKIKEFIDAVQDIAGQ